MGRKQKPGEKPKEPGEYIERGPRGGKVNDPRKATIDKKDGHMPPTQESGRQWERTGPPKK